MIAHSTPTCPRLLAGDDGIYGVAIEQLCQGCHLDFFDSLREGVALATGLAPDERYVGYSRSPLDVLSPAQAREHPDWATAWAAIQYEAVWIALPLPTFLLGRWTAPPPWLVLRDRGRPTPVILALLEERAWTAAPGGVVGVAHTWRAAVGTTLPRPFGSSTTAIADAGIARLRRLEDVVQNAHRAGHGGGRTRLEDDPTMRAIYEDIVKKKRAEPTRDWSDIARDDFRLSPDQWDRLRRAFLKR